MKKEERDKTGKEKKTGRKKEKEEEKILDRQK